jgi:hypothetical protein
MASSSSQNLQAAKPSTWPVGIASDTIQSVAKVDLPPHTEFAKLTHGDRTFYLGLKLVKLSCHEMIPNANVDPLYGSVFIKEIGNPSEANLVSWLSGNTDKKDFPQN